MEVKKGFKRWAPSAALAATLLASTSAFAGTATVDGVTFPTGFVPGGVGFVTQTVVETLITAAGQALSGVGFVQNIQLSPATVVWTQGQNGKFLDVVFSGFTSRTVTAPTATTPGTISFTGGTVGVYVFNGGLPNITTAGSIATDLANASSGTLWLSLVPEVLDASGDTLVVTIPTGQSTTFFTQATGSLLLDVTGGDAAHNFNTNTFFNAFTGGFADLDFTQSSFVNGSATDFNNGTTCTIPGSGTVPCHVQGTGHANFNTIPAPASLGLLGIGLLGFGLLKRRQAKSQA